MSEDADLDEEITCRVQPGWRRFNRVSWVLCDRKICAKVEGNVYKTVLRPAMMYEADACAAKKAQERSWMW